MRFNKIYVWSPLILIMVMFSLVLAQDHTLNCSRFQLNIGEAGSKSMHYPADFDANNMNADGSISFMANDWKTIDGNLVSRAWEVDLFRHSSKKVVKYGYPSLLIDGADASMPAEYDEIDPNLVADQKLD